MAATDVIMWDDRTLDATNKKHILFAVDDPSANSRVHISAKPFVRRAARDKFIATFVPADASDDIKNLFDPDYFSVDWKYPLGFIAFMPVQMADPMIAMSMAFPVGHPGGLYQLTATEYTAGSGKFASAKSKYWIDVDFLSESSSVDVDVKRRAIIAAIGKANVVLESCEPKKQYNIVDKNRFHCQIALTSAPSTWMADQFHKIRTFDLPGGQQGKLSMAAGMVDEVWLCPRCYAPKRPQFGDCMLACTKKVGGGSASTNSAAADFEEVFKRMQQGANKKAKRS